MRLPSLRRTLNMTLGGAVGAAIAFIAQPQPASANVEVGATAGLHTFSVNNELGVLADVESATSLRNSAFSDFASASASATCSASKPSSASCRPKNVTWCTTCGR
jgi:hypothetical protein